MTDKKTEALKLALDAICGSGDFLFNWHDCEPNNEREMQRYQATLAANEKAFRVIREALAEQPAQQQEPVCDKDPQGCWSVRCQLGKVCKNKYPPASKPHEQQEPVACKTLCELCVKRGYHFCANAAQTTPIPSPPAQRTWVGLTEEDRLDIWKKSASIDGAINATASKLREKNNG